MEALKKSILERVAAFPGHTSFYFKDLTSGESFSYNSDEPMSAASVIKLTVMAELFRQIEEGKVSREQKLVVKDENRVPICGVLTLMHSGMEVTPIDLCWLMITISDNMATNMLIDLLGIPNIQANIERLGLEGVQLNRKLFEKRPEFRGLRNYVSAAGIGKLLEMIYKGEVVSKAASDEMIEMMLAQQCTNKIPLLLPGEGRAAHKTGEDDGTTHDTGIIYAKKPFIVCFVNWQLEEGTEGKMNVQIGQITRELWDAMGGEPQEA